MSKIIELLQRNHITPRGRTDNLIHFQTARQLVLCDRCRHQRAKLLVKLARVQATALQDFLCEVDRIRRRQPS